MSVLSPIRPVADCGSQSSAAKPRYNQRRCGRLRCHDIACSSRGAAFGAVLDLSASGARVLRRGWSGAAVGQSLPLTLTYDELTVHLQAEVVWQRRLGFRRQHLGLWFVNLTDESRRALSMLADAARL